MPFAVRYVVHTALPACRRGCLVVQAMRGQRLLAQSRGGMAFAHLLPVYKMTEHKNSVVWDCIQYVTRCIVAFSRAGSLMHLCQGQQSAGFPSFGKHGTVPAHRGRARNLKACHGGAIVPARHAAGG